MLICLTTTLLALGLHSPTRRLASSIRRTAGQKMQSNSSRDARPETLPQYAKEVEDFLADYLTRRDASSPPTIYSECWPSTYGAEPQARQPYW